MNISKPIFIVGYKDKPADEHIVRKALAIECICNIIIGKSSNLYQKLYKEGLISNEISYNYEYSKKYAHLLIQSTSNNPEKVAEELEKEINYFIENGFNETEFNRIKKKMYGEYVKEYNDVSYIGNNFLSNYFKGINPFEFLEECAVLDKSYVEQVLKEVFNKDKKVLSIVKPNK